MWISWALGLQAIAQTSTNKQMFRNTNNQMIQAHQLHYNGAKST